MATATAVSSARGAKQFQGMFSEMWSVVCTLDPQSVAAGAQASDVITVPGVRVGDIVLGVSISTALAASPTITARVTADDTVSFTLMSGTGVTADIASGTCRLVIGRLAP